ncbi:MAG: hypothetical protein ACOYMR_09890 [Ilumatobacteraceae bacterium]
MGITLVGVFALSGIAACSVLRADVIRSTADDTAAAVAQHAGWTRDVLSPDYLVVVNVLPGEEMFTTDQQTMTHPTGGELIIEGEGRPLGSHVRHVEAHIYRRDTGKVVTDIVPRITLTNRTTGEVIDVEATLMQDVNIGQLDRHFGNNVMVMPDSDIRVTVRLGDQEVSVDGHLD